MREVLVSNETTVLADSAAALVVAAVQTQLDRDFCPAWGLAPVKLTFVSGKPPIGVEVIHLLDTSDVADALGYHDQVLDIPVGFVLVETTIKDGQRWEATLSHEAMEEVGDPLVNRVMTAPWLGKPAILAYEAGDPVEDDSYEIDGVPVSNFVLPVWFSPGPLPLGGQYADFLGKVPPLGMTAGGYQSYSLNLKTWRQTIAPQSKAKGKLTHPYSRASRRIAKHKGLLA